MDFTLMKNGFAINSKEICRQWDDKISIYTGQVC